MMHCRLRQQAVRRIAPPPSRDAVTLSALTRALGLALIAVTVVSCAMPQTRDEWRTVIDAAATAATVAAEVVRAAHTLWPGSVWTTQ